MIPLSVGLWGAMVRDEPGAWWILVAGGGGGLLVLFIDSRIPVRDPSVEAEPLRVRWFHGTLPSAERHVRHPYGLVFPARRGRFLFWALASSTGVVVGGALVGTVIERWWDARGGGSLAALPFGFAGAALIWIFAPTAWRSLGAALGRGNGIVVLREGIYCRMEEGTAWLPWDLIQAPRVAGYDTGQTVGFQFREGADRDRIVVGGRRSLLYRLNNRFLKTDLHYPGGMLAGPVPEIVAVMQRLARDPGLRARLGDASVLRDVLPPGLESRPERTHGHGCGGGRMPGMSGRLGGWQKRL